MKRILLDTNVLLDVVLARKPHAEAGEALWEMIEEHNAEGRLAAHAITTFYYLLRKERDHVRAKHAVHSLLHGVKPTEPRKEREYSGERRRPRRRFR